MSKSQHTPGPWSLDFGQHDAAIHAGCTLAMVDDTAAHWRANARLIAEAPAMVEVLQQALRIIDAHRRTALGDGDICANNIRAILARIDGNGEG